MYCPNCAAANSDTTKFCRACGANLSLVQQAMSGELIESRPNNVIEDLKHKHKHQPGIASGIQKTFVGLAFLIIAVMLWFSRMTWGIWLLIPGFAMLGKGVAEIAGDLYGEGSTSRPTVTSAARGAGELPPRAPSEFIQPPPSVTENTTRQLDPSVKRSKETG